MPKRRIEICGGIASGKTTLASLLRPKFTDILEDFSANPFFDQFYKNPSEVAFETEITFLLQHFNSIQTSSDISRVHDFSFALDLAYANVTLTNADLRVFHTVWELAFEKVGSPDFLIRLRCGANEELRRIQVRGRPQEQRIELKYLVDIDCALDEVIAKRFAGMQVLEIDSEKVNFAHIDKDKDVAKAMILDFVTPK